MLFCGLRICFCGGIRLPFCNRRRTLLLDRDLFPHSLPFTPLGLEGRSLLGFDLNLVRICRLDPCDVLSGFDWIITVFFLNCFRKVHEIYPLDSAVCHNNKAIGLDAGYGYAFVFFSINGCQVFA